MKTNATIFTSSPIDWCVVHASYVGLMINQSEVNDLENLLTSMEAKAQQESIKKLEVIVPTQQADKYIPKLIECGFSPILYGLRKNPIDFGPNEVTSKYEPQITITHNTAGVKDIRRLLEAQATYHHLKRPDYYLSVNQINWQKYTAEMNDMKSAPLVEEITAIQSGAYIGFLYGQVIKGEFQLWDIIVDENVRNQGVGSLLIQEIEKKYNKVPIVVDTIPADTTVKWYQKRKFNIETITLFKNV